MQAQAAGSKVADKAKNVASDLSELPNLTKQPNFFKGEGEVNATNEVKNKVRPQSFKVSVIHSSPDMSQPEHIISTETGLLKVCFRAPK